MTTYHFPIRVQETLHLNNGQTNEVEYVYEEDFGQKGARNYHILVKRQDYERQAASVTTPALPFDSFLKVLRPFMMGEDAAGDIPEAFHLLDTDHSGTIDIGELAAFMPIIVPNANPYVLLHQVQKVDKNGDYKLNIDEFTALIKAGIGRDIAIGRL